MQWEARCIRLGSGSGRTLRLADEDAALYWSWICGGVAAIVHIVQQAGGVAASHNSRGVSSGLITGMRLYSGVIEKTAVNLADLGWPWIQ